MSDNWQKTFLELSDYISSHPEIEINADVIHIPKNVRSGFYDFFKNIGAEFIKENVANLYSQARNINENYLDIEHEIMSLFGLSDITLTDEMRGFLNNPTDQVGKVISAPLFNLLKERRALKYSRRVL
jgi:hypothetical protein